jgi:acyl-CoA thioester hydrolase
MMNWITFGKLEELRVTLELAEPAADGSRFAIHNTFFRRDGTMAARVKSRGGWIAQREN